MFVFDNNCIFIVKLISNRKIMLQPFTKRKSLLTAALLMFVWIDAMAQDVIVLRSGVGIQAEIMEVGTDDVKYRKLDGTTLILKKYDISIINYGDGRKEEFNESHPLILPVYAKDNSQNVVYQKPTGIIRGTIIEHILTQSLKIETADRNVFAFRMDEVEKLTREPFPGRSDSFGTGSQKGYRGIVELGYQAGGGIYDENRFKLNIINGYQFNPYFSLGFGAGLRSLNNKPDILLPLFADFRVTFINKKVSPYMSLGTGYSFNATNSFFGYGFLLSPTIGVRFGTINNTAINVGFSYERQRAPDRYNYGWWSSASTPHTSHTVGFTIGFSF